MAVVRSIAPALYPASSARNVMQPGDNSVTPLVIRRAAGTGTGFLLEWRENDDSVAGYIAQAGGIRLLTNGGLRLGFGNAAGFSAVSSDSNTMEIQGPQAGATGSLRLGNSTGGIVFLAPLDVPQSINIQPSAGATADVNSCLTVYDGTYGLIFRIRNGASGVPGKLLGRGFDIVNWWAGEIPLSVAAASGQTAPLQEWQNSSGVMQSKINQGGYFITKKNAAPADGDLAANEMALWFDPTNGASKLMVKAKQADGTVKTGSLALA